MRLRVQGPSGRFVLALPDTSTWADLKSEISAKSSVPDFDVKYGYPPQALDTAHLNATTKLTDLSVKLDGEQLIISPRSSSSSSSSSSAATTPSAAAAPPSLTRKPAVDPTLDPPEIPLPALSSVLVLRIMPDDNSCLFRALGSAVLSSAVDAMSELRAIIASTIQAQPSLYTSAVLERPRDEYCAWIQREDSWGGGIELAILSQYFGVEVCSVNVQDLRVDRFNEGAGRRCVLVYSGIHYDVVAANPVGGGGGPPELDRKVFEVVRVEGGEDEDGGVLEAARELCRTLRERHYYTDTYGFTVKCNTCGWSGKGEKAATQHAKETSHYDFGEA